MWEKILVYIFGPILSALLLWVGWLIKDQIRSREKQRKQQEEYSLSMLKVSDCLDATVATLVAITETMKVSLQCHDLEFQSLHDSGVINGESIKQRKKIAIEIAKLDGNKDRIIKIMTAHGTLFNKHPQEKEETSQDVYDD